MCHSFPFCCWALAGCNGPAKAELINEANQFCQSDFGRPPLLLLHSGLRMGMTRTSNSGLLNVVKILSGRIFPCQLYLKHSKWQIYYNLIFLNQCQNFMYSWWVHVKLRLYYIINMYFWLKNVILHLVCVMEAQFYTN